MDPGPSTKDLGLPNTDLRFVQPRAPAHGTLSRLREPLVVKREPAGPASRRNDEDLVAGSSGGPKRMTQILLDVIPLQPELPREPRHRPRLVGKQSE
jgi:hypothetical protein